MRYAQLIAAAAVVLTAEAVHAQEWAELTPAAGPAPQVRRNAAAVYDSARHRMIVFGGRGLATVLNDVWAFDLSTNQWSDITPASGPAPGPRLTPDAVVDAQTQSMITWSGQGIGGAFFNDTWSFDFAGESWTDLTPAAPIPNIRYGTASVFDPVTREQVTFAGFTNQGRFDDTWRFDVDTEIWTDVTAGTKPLERCLHTAAYDAARHRMIMYGGQNAGPRSDWWAFDLATDSWTELTPPWNPSGRWFAASVYDALNDRMLVFGGNVASSKTNEVLAFDLDAATVGILSPAGMPPTAREGATAIYIRSEDRMVIFGGRDNGLGLLNDVWELRIQTPSLSVPSPAPAGGVTLAQNAPNPFRTSTVIGFDLPRAERVRMSVFDAQGREVRVLSSDRFEAGRHSVGWDGRDAQGRIVRSGVYFYRLQTSRGQLARRLVIER